MFFSRLFRHSVISGSIVDLRKRHHVYDEDSVSFDILLHDTDTVAGMCDLRFGYTWELYYAGNIGYRIHEPYRGHSYAYYACRLLLEQAYEQYGMKELYITCSPDNIASKKTIEKLGAVFVTEEDVPPAHWLYKRGETKKRIYKIFLP